MSENNTLNHPESEQELETLENGGQPVEEAAASEEAAPAEEGNVAAEAPAADSADALPAEGEDEAVAA